MSFYNFVLNTFVQYIDDHIINSNFLHGKNFKMFSRKINDCGSFGTVGYLLQSRGIFSKVFVFFPEGLTHYLGREI